MDYNFSAPTAEKLTCYKIAKKEFSATKNNLLMQIPRLSMEYKLEFEINVRSFPTELSNI